MGDLIVARFGGIRVAMTADLPASPRDGAPPLGGPVVILGARGLLGTPLAALLAERPGVALHAFGHAELDITDSRALDDVARLRPAVIVNCAAFTQVDTCESQPDRAERVNAAAAGAVAAVARAAGARLVHVSTDYVFAGDRGGAWRESDPTGPAAALCVYGRTKLAGERAVLAAGGETLIVRTSWLFGPAGPNFVATILAAARSRPELRVVNDQRGRPTYAPDLAAAIVALLDRGATGVVHVANAGACTWHKFAGAIVRAAGLATPVHPCSTAEFPRPARRPANSVLDTSRYESIVGFPMRPWQTGLAEYVTLLRAR
ncbi:MAG: dTDP-4-dehydrorhamnose reductase [Phycisphaerae bacterium]